MKKPKAEISSRVINKDASPCANCWKVDKFAFKGCAKDCQKMFVHLKKVFAVNSSPCLDLRCGIPGANKTRIGICEKCPLPEVYVKRIGCGAKSAFAREVIPPPEGFYKHQYSYKK